MWTERASLKSTSLRETLGYLFPYPKGGEGDRRLTKRRLNLMCPPHHPGALSSVAKRLDKRYILVCRLPFTKSPK